MDGRPRWAEARRLCRAAGRIPVERQSLGALQSRAALRGRLVLRAQIRPRWLAWDAWAAVRRRTDRVRRGRSASVVLALRVRPRVCDRRWVCRAAILRRPPGGRTEQWTPCTPDAALFAASPCGAQAALGHAPLPVSGQPRWTQRQSRQPKRSAPLSVRELQQRAMLREVLQLPQPAVRRWPAQTVRRALSRRVFPPRGAAPRARREPRAAWPQLHLEAAAQQPPFAQRESRRPVASQRQCPPEGGWQSPERQAEAQ